MQTAGVISSRKRRIAAGLSVDLPLISGAKKRHNDSAESGPRLCRRKGRGLPHAFAFPYELRRATDDNRKSDEGGETA